MSLIKSWIPVVCGAGLWLAGSAGRSLAVESVRGLEFGPYVGAYDFDRSTWFEDDALFGLRASVALLPSFRVDAEFDEVYTRRQRSGNSARQVSLALHGRLEPRPQARFSPSLLAGLAFVGLDDSEDPDAFSEAYDMGAGLRCRLTPRWAVRADWMLRAQRFQVLQIPRDGTGGAGGSIEDAAAGVEPSTLWGRVLRVGASYAF